MITGNMSLVTTTILHINPILVQLMVRTASNVTDDTLIYSNDFDTHIDHLQQIFDKLRAANLTLKPSECIFGADKVNFLGHVFSKDGVAPNPDKTKAVDTFPRPTNPTQIKAYLDSANTTENSSKTLPKYAHH